MYYVKEPNEQPTLSKVEHFSYDVLDFLNGEYENDRDDINEGEDHYSSDDQDDLDIVDFHNEGDDEETPTNTEEVLDDPKSDFIDPEYKVFVMLRKRAWTKRQLELVVIVSPRRSAVDCDTSGDNFNPM
ncbi:hypothetical protein Tco_0957333 [Tanacetum coccineum]